MTRLTILATALVALPALAQPNPRLRAAAESIVAADLMRDATYLASDALRGRGTPSPGLDSAQRYVVARLTRLGVRPAGDDGTYFQRYTVARSTLDTTRTTASLGGRQLAYGADFVVRSFLTPGVREGGVVYVGAGIRAPRLKLDPYAGVDVRGRWLLVHASAPPRGVGMQQLGQFGVDYTTATEEARSRGALGVLVLPNAQTVALWNELRAGVPTSRELEPSVGRAFAPSPLPQIVLSRAAVESLLAGQPVSAARLFAADSTRERPASFALGGPPLRIDVAATTTRFQASNVVALVEGSDARLKDEWISASSHLDGAVGRAPSAGGDSIYNAADDNASGSAGMLSIARALLRAPRPKRSILLIWDSGEETGLWGSRFLAYGPLADRVVAHFTVDMIARTRRPGTSVPGEEELSGPDTVFAAGPRTLSTQMDAVLGRVSRDFGWVTFDRRFDDPTHEFFYPRTDAAPYLERGIPYVEIFTGLHGDYHRPSDKVAKFDPGKFQAVTRTIFTALWTLADDPVRPRIDRPLPAVISFVVPR